MAFVLGSGVLLWLKINPLQEFVPEVHLEHVKPKFKSYRECGQEFVRVLTIRYHEGLMRGTGYEPSSVTFRSGPS